MAKAPIAATRQSADRGANARYSRRDRDNRCPLTHCLVWFPPDIFRAFVFISGLRWFERPQRILKRGIFERRRIFRRWRFFGWGRGIGELVMDISTQDRERISHAIRTAEARTSGEIVCVLAKSSSDTLALPILVAAVVALALPWLLIALTEMTVHGILSMQIFVFLTSLVIL